MIFFFPFSPNEYDNKLKHIDRNVNLTDLPNKIFYRLDVIARKTEDKQKTEFITFLRFVSFPPPKVFYLNFNI